MGSIDMASERVPGGSEGILMARGLLGSGRFRVLGSEL